MRVERSACNGRMKTAPSTVRDASLDEFCRREALKKEDNATRPKYFERNAYYDIEGKHFCFTIIFENRGRERNV